MDTAKCIGIGLTLGLIVGVALGSYGLGILIGLAIGGIIRLIQKAKAERRPGLSVSEMRGWTARLAPDFVSLNPGDVCCLVFLFGCRQDSVNLADLVCELLDNEVRLRHAAAIIHDGRGSDPFDSRFEIAARLQ